MDNDLTSVEVLGFAIQAEIEAGLFYRHMAKVILNPMVRAKILSLANEEDAHRDILTSLYGKFTGESAPPLPASEAEGSPKPEEFVAANLVKLFKLAYDKEVAAATTYEKGAKTARDASARQIFEKLAAFERGHADYMKRQWEKAKDDPAWFENADGSTLLLLGP